MDPYENRCRSGQAFRRATYPLFTDLYSASQQYLVWRNYNLGSCVEMGIGILMPCSSIFVDFLVNLFQDETGHEKPRP